MAGIAVLGFAVAHVVRVRALEVLMSGKMLPNGELARICRVPASSMSDHLAVLLKADLVTAVRSGRYRYYAIASDEAAAFIEAAGVLARPDLVRSLREAECSKLEKEARMCFDHLAGRLGVGLLQGLFEQGALERHGDVALVTARGAPILADLAWRPVPLGFVLPCCVDYSERTFHLRGPVAAAIAAAFLQRKWVRHGPRRSLIVTPEGRKRLIEFLR